MKKIKYIIKCIFHLNFGNMFNIINKINKKSHKSKVYLFFDIVFCGFKYGAGYYDYQEFEFYNLNKYERRTYLTRAKNNLIIKRYNNPESMKKFDNKGEFNQIFNKYLKRDYLIIDDQSIKNFIKFTKKHSSFIAKPIDGDGGRGVVKYSISDYKSINELFAVLLLRKQNLLEECIIQNSKINKIYSKSVNSLRLFTFYDGNAVYVVNSVFKLGNGGITDNFSGGSMYTFLNDSGKVIVPAIDKDDNIYVKHPISHEKIEGFLVPFYMEACNMVKETSLIIPDVKYIGWDVAITDIGPVIIEGNCYPGVFQVKPSLKKHGGLIPKYEKHMIIK